jgi:hydrogenase-4 component E
MINLLLIIFIVTLFVCATAIRLKTFIKAIAFQGLLLFGIFFLRLNELNTINLVLLLLETLIFKAMVIPWFLHFLIKRNKITRETDPYVSNFASLFIITFVVMTTFFLANTLKGGVFENIYFVIASITIFTGLFLIISRRKIITHVMSFIILENGVVILSLAVGVEMPMLVNLGILLDIFVTVLVLGIFAIKIGDIFKEAEVDHLKGLKD